MASSLSPRFETSRGFRDDAQTGPTVGVRLRALVHRGRLDRMLADGADPGSSRELALRGQRLTRRTYRRALADGFDEAVSTAEGHELRLSAGPPLAAREVRASRAALLELSRALRSERQVAPAGVALAQRLLTDGTGPLYLTSEHDALWHAARRATVALELTA
jgi:hypothetical protein